MQNKSRTLVRPFACIAALLLITACERAEDRPPGAAQGQAAQADATTPAASPQEQHAEAVGDAEAVLRRISGHRLSMDNIRRMAQALEGIAGHAEGDPALQRQLSGMSVWEAGIDGVIRAYQSLPRVEREIRRAGLTVEDFVMTSLSLAMTMSAILSDAGDEEVARLGTTPRNVALVEQNRAEIEGIIQRLNELSSDWEEEDDDPYGAWDDQDPYEG